MNTETLRAIEAPPSGNPSLGADGILNASFLSSLAPGTPFMVTELSFAGHAADPKARSPADRAA